jgi:hypothetical protein
VSLGLDPHGDGPLVGISCPWVRRIERVAPCSMDLDRAYMREQG